MKGPAPGTMMPIPGLVFPDGPQQQELPFSFPVPKGTGRHPSSQRFHDILKEAGELHDYKQQTYGNDQDPFANVNASAEFGIPPWLEAANQVRSNMVRIAGYVRQGKLKPNERGLRNALIDAMVYSGIALVLLEQELAREGD